MKHPITTTSSKPKQQHPKGMNQNKDHKSSQSPYHEASDLLNRILNKMEVSSSSSQTKNKKSSNHNYKSTNYIPLLKSSVTNKEGKLQVSSKTYAIVAKVLQNKSKIDTLIEATNILTDSDHIKNMGLFYVMLYELLFASATSSTSSSSPPRRNSNTIKGGGTVKRYILQYESILREKYQEHYGTPTNNSNNHSENRHDDDDDEYDAENHNHHYQLPPHRYVRVNTCVTTINDFLQLYSAMRNTEDEGATIRPIESTTKTMERIYRDAHIPDLLVIPSNETSKLLSTLTDQNKMNHIVLQDKSSCIPAYCLYSLLSQHQQQQQQQGSSKHTAINEINVLDACAAPGNKTSHVAALLLQLQNEQQTQLPEQQQKQKGSVRTTKTPTSIGHTTIYAMDRDRERCQILQDRMTLLVPSASNLKVMVQNKDFLTIHGHDDNEYSNLTCIVLDPSCSGSGLYHRNGIAVGTKTGTMMDQYHPMNNIDPQQYHRIQKLSNFQITCLRHALTSFPKVHTVIYSTCSEHILENEYVVASVFGSSSDNDDVNSNTSHRNLREEWSIVAPPDLHHWERRGVDIRQTTNRDGDGGGGDDGEAEHDIDELYGDLTKEEISCFIRTNNEDRTNGFFVACFQRKNILQSPVQVKKPKKPQGPPKWNIPIYDGELEQMIHPSEVVVAKKRKSRTTSSNDIKNNGTGGTSRTTSNVINAAAPTNKKRKLEMKQTTTNTTIPISGPTSAATAAATTTTTTNMNCKKRAKKLEWKQRQHEAKLLRTKSEKANKKKK